MMRKKSYYQFQLLIIAAAAAAIRGVKGDGHYPSYCVNSFGGLKTKEAAFADPLNSNDPPGSHVDKTIGEYVAMSPVLTTFANGLAEDAVPIVSTTVGYGPEGKTFPLILCTNDYSNCSCAAFVDDQLCSSCEICEEGIQQGNLPVTSDCSNVKSACSMTKCQNTNNIPYTCQYDDPMTCIGVDIPTIAPDPMDAILQSTPSPTPSSNAVGVAVPAAGVFGLVLGALATPFLLFL